MKSFIERIFKVRKEKQDAKQAETIKNETINPSEEIKEVKKETKHIDCECRECIRRIKRAQYK